MPRNPDRTVPSSTYWELPALVANQDRPPTSEWYEDWLLAQLPTDARKVYVIGCGAGRELPAVRRALPRAELIGVDLSTRMLAACRLNLERWELTDDVQLICADLADLGTATPGEVVIAFNNVFNFVVPRARRAEGFAVLRDLCTPGGTFVGVVHHRWGRPSKSLYFAAKLALHGFRPMADPAGDRSTGFDGTHTDAHYFLAGELATELRAAGFGTLDVASLGGLGSRVGRRYRRRAGSNNLVFRAVNDGSTAR